MELTNRLAAIMDQLAAERSPKKVAAPRKPAQPKAEAAPKKSRAKPKAAPPAIEQIGPFKVRQWGGASILFMHRGEIVDFEVEVTPDRPDRPKGQDWGCVRTPAGWISVRAKA